MTGLWLLSYLRCVWSGCHWVQTLQVCCIQSCFFSSRDVLLQLGQVLVILMAGQQVIIRACFLKLCVNVQYLPHKSLQIAPPYSLINMHPRPPHGKSQQVDTLYLCQGLLAHIDNIQGCLGVRTILACEAHRKSTSASHFFIS